LNPRQLFRQALDWIASFLSEITMKGMQAIHDHICQAEKSGNRNMHLLLLDEMNNKL
jgi:hypothetical protein